MSHFYKTKLCPWFPQGRCNRGEACNWAHSETELRPSVDLTRTKLCETLLQNGCCENPTCRFAHAQEELRATTDYYKTSLCVFWMRNSCAAGNQCRHAHGTQELRVKPKTQPNMPTPALLVPDCEVLGPTSTETQANLTANPQIPLAICTPSAKLAHVTPHCKSTPTATPRTTQTQHASPRSFYDVDTPDRPSARTPTECEKLPWLSSSPETPVHGSLPEVKAKDRKSRRRRRRAGHRAVTRLSEQAMKIPVVDSALLGMSPSQKTHAIATPTHSGPPDSDPHSTPSCTRNGSRKTVNLPGVQPRVRFALSADDAQPQPTQPSVPSFPLLPRSMLCDESSTHGNTDTSTAQVIPMYMPNGAPYLPYQLLSIVARNISDHELQCAQYVQYED